MGWIRAPASRSEAIGESQRQLPAGSGRRGEAAGRTARLYESMLKAKFMRVEVGMGILPCGGGASRMVRQVGLGRALEIVLGARDFDADQAGVYGTIDRALDAAEIGPFVEALAKRIALWPSESINACK